MRCAFLRLASAAVWVVAALSLCAGCRTVPFGRIAPPAFATLDAEIPTPPEPKPIEKARAEAQWRVVDRTAKASVRKKLVAAQVLAHGPGADLPVLGRGALTTSLLVRLMNAGFTSLQDLSSAPEVTAEVQRGPGVLLKGTLDHVIPLTSPLKADYVLTVAIGVLPASSLSSEVRYSIPESELQAYRAAHERFQTSTQEYLKRLEATFADYNASFDVAKVNYEKARGGYSSFPRKTEGLLALEERQSVRADYDRMHKLAQTAMLQPPAPDQFASSIGRKVDTESRMQSRVLAWVSMLETGSNRVVWLATFDSSTADVEAEISGLLDRVVTSLPGDPRGAR